ncbi:unnamed protein product, partial [marine sediment metagenome]
FWFLRHCVNRIRIHTSDYELILVDNGSDVGVEFMKKEADKYIRNDKNLGFAVACNQGFEVCEGEFIVCSNNDIFVYRDWARALYWTFSDNPDCGVAMPGLMKQTDDARVALEISEPDLSVNYDKYGRGAEFGSCFMVKKELFDKLKEEDGYVFDERFLKAFSEDRDLWRRVRLMGLETIRTHKTRIFHQGNATVAKLENRKQYTSPNRIYFHKLQELETKENKLTEKEKDSLREDAQREYEDSLKT